MCGGIGCFLLGLFILALIFYWLAQNVEPFAHTSILLFGVILLGSLAGPDLEVMIWSGIGLLASLLGLMKNDDRKAFRRLQDVPLRSLPRAASNLQDASRSAPNHLRQRSLHPHSVKEPESAIERAPKRGPHSGLSIPRTNSEDWAPMIFPERKLGEVSEERRQWEEKWNNINRRIAERAAERRAER